MYNPIIVRYQVKVSMPTIASLSYRYVWALCQNTEKSWFWRSFARYAENNGSCTSEPRAVVLCTGARGYLSMNAMRT